MIALFNRLQATFGARLKLIGFEETGFTFEIKHWRTFGIIDRDNPCCREFHSHPNGQGFWAEETPASKWLLAIAQGKTRDAEGKVAENSGSP